MAVEAKRGCGYRKVGGTYLVGSGAGEPCDRLPILLTVCPCCSQGIKQSRGWTWIYVSKLVDGAHRECRDTFPCPLCMATENMGKAGLLWIGERFYKTPGEFMREASDMGISRRISAVPRDFKMGETWVLLAHPKAVTCPKCKGGGLETVEVKKSGLAPTEIFATTEKCQECEGSGKLPGIFYVFRPSAIERIITETQSKDADLMADLEKKGIRPVVVPDDDKDHMGTVYDKGKQVSYSALLKQVRPHLMSRDVEFSFDEDGQGGDVIVGGFRHVGRFRLEGVTIGEVVHVTL